MTQISVGSNDDEYQINHNYENYSIKLKDSKEIKLEDILLELIINIKNIVKEFINYELYDIYLFFEKDLIYDKNISMKIAGVLSGIKIINILDLSTFIKFYLDMKHISFPACFSIIIPKNNNIEISVYKNERKIFKNFKISNN